MSGEIRTEKDQRNITLKVRTVPTIFENGTRGTTLLIEDVSKERERLKNLEFLARTSAELADMGDEEDIYRYIAERVRELLPNSTISIGSLDDEKSTLTIMGVAGEPEEFERCRRLLGRDPRGLTFTFASEPLAAEQLAKKTLTECPDLNSLFFSQFPPQITDLMGEIFSFGKGYAMGCVCRGGIFGDVAILLKKGQKLRHRETIEAFIRQASVALQRRHMREKLRRTESQLEALKNQR